MRGILRAMNRDRNDPANDRNGIGESLPFSVIPAKAGIPLGRVESEERSWIPAFAGMTSVVAGRHWIAALLTFLAMTRRGSARHLSLSLTPHKPRLYGIDIGEAA